MATPIFTSHIRKKMSTGIPSNQSSMDGWGNLRISQTIEKEDNFHNSEITFQTSRSCLF